MPEEKERFLRAITLVGRVFGYSAKIMKEAVEHEKEHIQKVEELGLQSKIKGYEIEIHQACKLGLGGFNISLGKDRLRASVVRLENLSDSEFIKILMAPKNPSKSDFSAVMQILGYKGQTKSLYKIMKQRKDVSDYRIYLIDQASSLEAQTKS